MGSPSADLPGEEALGVAEVAEADFGGVNGVQPGQRVDQLERGGSCLLLGEVRNAVGVGVHDAVEHLHQVEGRTKNGLILAVGHHLWHRDAGDAQRGLHPVLATHVVGLLKGPTHRGPPQDPVVDVVAHSEREVRVTARERLHADNPGGCFGVVR